MSAEVAHFLQRGIERFYRLESAPAVRDFLRAPGPDGRETVRVHCAEDGEIEIEVVAPELAPNPDLDSVCQVIEGVSHFLYLAERARTELPATHLELELQAEVDKYVVLALLPARFEPTRARRLRERLYERVVFVHPEGTAEGERYRLANDLAARLVHRLDATYARRGRFPELRDRLARFYRMGQEEKLRYASAA